MVYLPYGSGHKQSLDEVCGCLSLICSRSDRFLHVQPIFSYTHIHNNSVLAAMSLLKHTQCQEYTLSKMLPISTLRMNLICCYLLLRLASEQYGCSTGPLSGTPPLSCSPWLH